MTMLFADTLKKLRKEKGLSQHALAKKMFVTNATVSRWETGRRLPDAAMITRLSEVLEVDVNTLLFAASDNNEQPQIMMLDDNKIILAGAMPVLEELFPTAKITGFTKPSEALEFAKNNRVALAFLDIEMGTVSGLDVCRALLEISPHTNVIYLTAYSDYALDAWGTEASGFIVKPLTAEAVLAQLSKLRYPIACLGGDNA